MYSIDAALVLELLADSVAELNIKSVKPYWWIDIEDLAAYGICPSCNYKIRKKKLYVINSQCGIQHRAQRGTLYTSQATKCRICNKCIDYIIPYVGALKDEISYLITIKEYCYEYKFRVLQAYNSVKHLMNVSGNNVFYDYYHIVGFIVSNLVTLIDPETKDSFPWEVIMG